MWLLIALFGLLCLVALIEHLHWRYWRCWIDSNIQHAYARDALHQIRILQALEQTVNIAEQLYEISSDFGCPYPPHTRAIVADALGSIRKLIVDQTGPNPFYFDAPPQGRWPFDTEGKVKV